MRGHLATGCTWKHSGGLQRPVLEAKNGTDQSALGIWRNTSVFPPFRPRRPPMGPKGESPQGLAAVTVCVWGEGT